MTKTWTPYKTDLRDGERKRGNETRAEQEMTHTLLPHHMEDVTEG